MVDKLLVALWHAEFQCRYGLYRSGLILLADISLEFGMTKKSRRMLEEIMPQVCQVILLGIKSLCWLDNKWGRT
jgi:hypothetical protein